MSKRNSFFHKSIAIVLIFILIASTVSGCSVGKKTEIKPSKTGTYNITLGGFSQIEKSIRKCANLPEKLDINYFNAAISEDCNIKNFTLGINGFDSNNNFKGSYSFIYSGSNKALNYTMTKPSESMIYNKNYDISYLDSEIKRLPLKSQISKLHFPQYVISFQSDTKLSAGDPVIDGSTGKNFPVLSFSDYKKCIGGKSDGHTAVIFTLYDGVSLISKNKICYKCKPADSSSLYGNRNFTMQCDYMISNNKLSFTRDYGETWIPSGLSKDQLSSTLNFYRSSSLPEGSYFVSKDTGIPIAFFYDSFCELMISKNNGRTWSSAPIEVDSYEKDITKRFIGFTDKNDGYAALGTDWTMGTGEEKFCYLTSDGGKTWVQKDLPLSGTSNTLSGICFSDKNNGIVSLKSPSGSDSWPTLYCTQDGASYWTEINIPWKSLPSDVDYLSKIDSLTYQDGIFTIVLGQGSDSAKKAAFKSSSLSGTWSLVKTYTSVTHTQG